MKNLYRGSLLIVACLLFWTALGCTGDKAVEPTLEGNLLQYEETDMVSFNLSGEAKCGGCDEEDVFAGLIVELNPADDPTHNLRVGTFSGLGHFSFSNLRAVAGSVIRVDGTLYIEGASSENAQTQFTVPNDDGQTVSIILNF